MTSEDFKTQTMNSTFTFFLNYIQDQIFENNTNGREKKKQDFLYWDGNVNGHCSTELRRCVTAAYLTVFNLEMFLCE